MAMTWDPDLLVMALAAFLAGAVRGFSGFGAAMILIPAVGAVREPAVAIPMLALIDNILTLPLLPKAFRMCRWRDVIPLAIGASVALPFGVWVLLIADPDVLQVAICLMILVLVGVLSSGWRYAGQPAVVHSLGVGSASGLLGGSTGIGGPPVILFWLGGQSQAPQVRANIIAYFAFTGVVNLAALAVGGLFTREVLGLSALLMPVYGLALWAGARSFRLASETFFRRTAYILIAAVAVGGLLG